MKQINKPGEVPYYSLVGLVSFGPAKCGMKDYPGNHYNLIKEELKLKKMKFQVSTQEYLNL